jgi:hypothetical protein
MDKSDIEGRLAQADVRVEKAISNNLAVAIHELCVMVADLAGRIA